MDIKTIPFKLTPGSEAERKLKLYLRDKVESLRLGLVQLHGMDGIIKWRKAYEAVPAEPVREFPWHNSSNLVVPVVAIHSDTLLARVMSAVIKTRPLWVVRELGNFAKEAPIGMRGALEEFLGYVGLEASELDLYRVYHEWFGEAIRLGTGVLKCPWTKTFIDKLGPAGDMSGKQEWIRDVTYEGPRPEKLRFENFKCPVNKGTIEEMDFKYDIIKLERYDLEERSMRGIYDSAAVKAVLMQPNNESKVGQVQAQKETDAKVRTVPGYGFAEWDICECHLKYRVDISHFAKLIVWYHYKSDQILRSFYHYYPDELYLAARLFFRDDMFHGMGFAEILLPFQEEISEIHNQRRDNMTVCNTKMWAVDPDSKLHKGYRTFPGAMLPARQTTGQLEISPLEHGTPVQGEIDSERLSLELAEKRSGVSPPMQGSGAGTNTKRGVYTAMGTLSLLQEGNTRTDLNITDIRYAHTRLGRLLALEYGSFGVNEQLLAKFGDNASKIKQALNAIGEGKMALPVSAATASVNREVEKQSDLMLVGVMERYHQGIAAMLTAINNPLTPEPIKKQAADAISAARTLMMDVLHHFDRDEVERLVPEVDAKPPQQGPPQGQPQLSSGQPGNPPQLQGQPGMVPPSVVPGPRGLQ
jgi:hypothetical protein